MRFKGEIQPAWSLCLYFEHPVDPVIRESYATVRYLVDGAPHDKLVDGARFELLEGIRVVAEGEIVA
jgi:hypothetical protein